MSGKFQYSTDISVSSVVNHQNNTTMNRSDILSVFERKPFIPHPLLKSGHAQTIVSAVLSRRKHLLVQCSEPRMFHLPHKIQILGHCSWQSDKKKTPCLVLIHGMEGSTESPYMIGTAEKALAAGLNVVRLNIRNCGGVKPNQAFYHAGLTEDLRQIFYQLREVDGVDECYLAGFSLGGNQSLKFAGEEKSNGQNILRGLVAVSPSVYLPTCIDALERHTNYLYHINFLRSIKRKVVAYNETYPGWVDASLLPKIRTLRKFDDVYTAPYSGFRDAADYYERASSRNYLADIQIPTLILHSEDDPFIPADPLHHHKVTTNPNLVTIITRHGGHVAFISAIPENNCRRWAESRVIDFVQTLRKK
ncbi:MAG TPA: alpha/beta fold hydrolase [Acidobacteriota bacterium]|nr:alpha/beta fold hydrolase [Acidobacteriota bacterium]